MNSWSRRQVDLGRILTTASRFWRTSCSSHPHLHLACSASISSVGSRKTSKKTLYSLRRLAIINVAFPRLPVALFEKPTLSVSIRAGRPGESWETEGAALDDGFLCCLHPRYLDAKRFSVVYEYYIFGLMLLEIGLWWPAPAWARKARAPDHEPRGAAPAAGEDLRAKIGSADGVGVPRTCGAMSDG